MGPVVVSGATFNNVMPPHAHLSDAEIAAVLTYVRNTWGNEGSMLTKEMVAKVRDQIADHPGPWKTEELEAFKDKNIPGDIPAGPGATAAPATGAAAPAPAK